MMEPTTEPTYKKDASIFISPRQQVFITKIIQNISDAKDIERDLANESKPRRFKSAAFVDCKLYCHFEKCQPTSLIIGDKDIGGFHLTRQHELDEERVFPKNARFVKWWNAEAKELSNFYITLDRGSDGVVEWNNAIVYDMNETMVKEFKSSSD